MTDQIIFYHCWNDTSINISHWFNKDIQLKIVVDNPPDNVVVYKQAPNIHWMTHTEFNTLKKTSKDKVFFGLPSLFHVPIFGNNFTIPKGYDVMAPVFDFDWVYYICSDNDNNQNIIRFSQHQLMIQNKMTDRGEWISKHIRPSWETFYKHRDQLDTTQKRIFLGLSKVLGEWKMVGELSHLCGWQGSIVEYDNAEVYFHTLARLPPQQRKQKFFLKLEKSSYWFETWWSLLECIEYGVDTSSIRGRLIKKAILYKEENFPEWCGDMPIHRWVQKKITDEDALYKYEIKLLKNFPDGKRYLLSKVLGLQNSHHLFTQESTNFLTTLCALDGCEKGDVLSSKEDMDYVPSSSGLIVYPENPRLYIVNVRKVNYRIMPNGSYITMKDGKVNNIYNGVSKNEFYFMDRETLKPVSPIRPMKEDIPGHRKEELAIVGLEDVRLVPGINQDILFYGVTKSYSYSNAIRIITGKYDVERTLFHSTNVIHPPYEENMCEKNWVWCGDNRFIYRWHPIEIGSVDANNRLVVDERIPSPIYFKEFRGSSPAVVWKGFQFFSVHSVAQGDNGRKYTHSIVVLDLEHHTLIAVSTPFCFEDIQIEYNIGLDIYKGKMLFLYSTRDSTSKYVRVPLHYILENLFFPDKQKELMFKTRIYQDYF